MCIYFRTHRIQEKITIEKGVFIVSFIDTIKARAKKDKKTIVLPETNDIRTIQAAVKVMEEDIADLVLLGDKDKIVQKAESYGYDLSGAASVGMLFKTIEPYCSFSESNRAGFSTVM